MKTLYSSVIFVLFYSVDLFSQNYVINTDSEPIESVSITYGINRGLITNEDGFFELPSDVSIDTLTLSHVLYKTKKIPPDVLKVNDTIFLEFNTIDLDEVVINTLSPREILTKAINNIDDNYLTDAHNSFGFYRQSVQEDGKGVEMIEVDFVSYFKDDFDSYTSEVTDARRTKNNSRHGIKIFGGVLNALKNGDFVRQKKAVLDIINIDNYNLVYEGKLTLDKRKVHKISFEPMDENSLSTLRKGILFIDAESYAIIELTSSIDERKFIQLFNASVDDTDPNNASYQIIKSETKLKYRQLRDSNKWVLSSLEGKNNFLGTYKKERYNYLLTVKLVINNVKLNKPIKIKTNYNEAKDFSKAIRRYDNLQGWDDNYKLSLSENEKRILKDIKNEKK